jgi:hypothetical protein
MHESHRPSIHGGGAKGPVTDLEKHTNAPTLIEEVSVLPERFFTFAQEFIALHWIDENQSRPARGVRRHK